MWVLLIFIDSEGTKQIYIVGEVNFGSLQYKIEVVVNITVVYLKRLNHKSNVLHLDFFSLHACKHIKIDIHVPTYGLK